MTPPLGASIGLLGRTPSNALLSDGGGTGWNGNSTIDGGAAKGSSDSSGANNIGPDTKLGGGNGNVPKSVTQISATDAALNEAASKNVGSVSAPIDFDGHIMQAELKKNGKDIVGGHSTATGDVQVVPGSAGTPNEFGVYEAKVQLPDPKNPGKFLVKDSTMFPDSWTADRVKVEVDAAFQNKTVVGNKWFGKTPSGVKVEGYLNPKTTVFPKR